MTDKTLPTPEQLIQARKLGADPRDLWPAMNGAAKPEPVYIGPVPVRLKDNKPTASRYVVLKNTTAALMTSLSGKTIALYESDKRERVTGELTEWVRSAEGELSAKLEITPAGKREIARDHLVMEITLRCRLDEHSTVLEVLDGTFSQSDRAPDVAARTFTTLTAEQFELCSKFGWDPMAIASEPGLFK